MAERAGGEAQDRQGVGGTAHQGGRAYAGDESGNSDYGAAQGYRVRRHLYAPYPVESARRESGWQAGDRSARTAHEAQPAGDRSRAIPPGIAEDDPGCGCCAARRSRGDLMDMNVTRTEAAASSE